MSAPARRTTFDACTPERDVRPEHPSRRNGRSPLIEATLSTKRFGATVAVDDLSFTVRPASSRGSSDRTARAVHHDARDRRTRAPHLGHGPRQRRPVAEHPRADHRDRHPAGPAVHGRTARGHLLRSRHARPRPGAGGRGASSPASTRSPASASAPSRWACTSASASPPRCSATRRRSCSTSRSTGSTPKDRVGPALPAQPRRRGADVFLSSHLMSEMAQTADHLIVIGRGRPHRRRADGRRARRRRRDARRRQVARGAPARRGASRARRVRHHRRLRRAGGHRRRRGDRRRRPRPRRAAARARHPHRLARGGLPP